MILHLRNYSSFRTHIHHHYTHIALSILSYCWVVSGDANNIGSGMSFPCFSIPVSSHRSIDSSMCVVGSMLPRVWCWEFVHLKPSIIGWFCVHVSCRVCLCATVCCAPFTAHFQFRFLIPCTRSRFHHSRSISSSFDSGSFMAGHAMPPFSTSDFHCPCDSPLNRISIIPLAFMFLIFNLVSLYVEKRYNAAEFIHSNRFVCANPMWIALPLVSRCWSSRHATTTEQQPHRVRSKWGI